MTIWMVFLAMTAVVLAVMLVPVFRARPAPAAGRDAWDMAVYRDQLAEVERDVERGLLTADQAEAARTEIQRRMLSAADGAKAPKARDTDRIGLAAWVMVVVAAVSFAGYAMLGSPHLPDLPYAGRTDTGKVSQAQAEQINAMVEGLAQRLAANPNDGRGWAMLGRSRRVLGQMEQAMAAYEKAMPLLPGDVDVRIEYAALLVSALHEGDTLPVPFVNVMKEILSINPQSPDALYYMGIAELQAGRADKARELWKRLLALLPADSPAKPEIERMIDEAR
jgi:cytochrome c-type biogenesis protein CcmH